MTQVNSDPSREAEPTALPNVEVFWLDYWPDYGNHPNGSQIAKDYPLLSVPGWYYWFCFPGCLPDSDPVGPFDSEQEAIADAQDY